MASGVNKVILIGNLGRDPEVRYTQSGAAVSNLRVAVTEKSKEGEEWVDKTEWVDVVCFGRTAENVGQYLAKGRQIYAEGRLQTRKWTDRDGNDRWSTEVVANRIVFLGSQGGGGGGGGFGGGGGPRRGPEQRQGGGGGGQGGGGGGQGGGSSQGGGGGGQGGGGGSQGGGGGGGGQGGDDGFYDDDLPF